MSDDKRITISKGGSFLSIVTALYNEQKQADILYEDNGVTRASGIITAIHEKDGQQSISLSDGLEISLDKLYAVNGTFTSDYSEC